jgi:hypothetical protein
VGFRYIINDKKDDEEVDLLINIDKSNICKYKFRFNGKCIVCEYYYYRR